LGSALGSDGDLTWKIAPRGDIELSSSITKEGGDRGGMSESSPLFCS